MIAQQTVQFFVRFKDGVPTPTNFRSNYDYPVFGIDVVDCEDNVKETSFLLSDSTNNFVWVNMNLLRRQPPRPKERPVMARSEIVRR